MRMTTTLCSGLILGLSVLVSTGCSSATVSAQPTVGEALQDLEGARDQGLLTESEYSKQRQEILKGS